MDYNQSFNQIAFNSAQTAARISKDFEERGQAENQHRAKLEAGAEAAIEQNCLLKQQVDLLTDQNKQRSENYDKLKELYDRQVDEADSAKEELRQSKRYNAWMMAITIISMLAAIAGPIISIFD